MKQKKFKMGKLQLAWLESLEAHPERQMKEVLGVGTPRSYKACCLGELLITSCRLKKKPFPFTNSSLMDGGDTLQDVELYHSYEKFGLRSSEGAIKNEIIEKDGKSFGSLAQANDGGVTWPEIAKFIRKNPESVFTKPV